MSQRKAWASVQGPGVVLIAPGSTGGHVHGVVDLEPDEAYALARELLIAAHRAVRFPGRNLLTSRPRAGRVSVMRNPDTPHEKGLVSLADGTFVAWVDLLAPGHPEATPDFWAVRADETVDGIRSVTVELAVDEPHARAIQSRMAAEIASRRW